MAARKQEWTEEEESLLKEMRTERGMTVAECAKELGRSHSSVKYKVQRHYWTKASQGDIDRSKESFSCSTKGDTATVVSVNRSIKTVEDALAYGEIDTDIWDVDRSTVNSWEVGMKMEDGSTKVVPLWQVKVTLKRKAPKFVQDGILSLCKSLPRYNPPKIKKSKIANPHLAEFSIFDAHFGKLCWAAETGEDYDTKIAERVYENAVHDLLAKISGYPIEKIWYPVGQDFFQVDNWSLTTAKGTPQDHDGRFQKVFQVGVMAVVRSIDLLSQVAPVEVYYVPGNHDTSTSWYMCACLEHRYEKSDRVMVDNSPRPRKCRTYGCSMVVFTHADKEPHRDLPTIAATEFPQEWAQSTHREAHVGHLHKKTVRSSVDVDEHSGFRVRVLPSLCGRDSWHYTKGYVGSRRAAEVYLWSKTEGYTGHFSVNVRE